MGRHSSKTFITLMTMGISFMFFISSIIPIIGPSSVAYVFGIGRHRFKKLYGLSRIRTLSAMTIGELIFFIISSLMIKGATEFYDQDIFWYIITSGLTLNYVFSIIFYFFGIYKARVRKKIEDRLRASEPER